MTESLQPENNPLLEAPGLCNLEKWLSNTSLLFERLRNDPFPQLGKWCIPLEKRRIHLDEYHKIFVPTPQVVRIADRILHIVYAGLQRRNPRRPEVQRWLNSTQQWLGKPLEDIPWQTTQALGIVIEGMTGIGKSHVVDRVLSLLPQVVDHTPNGDWGMLKLRQLVWIKVHMPAAHTRKGLLIALLAEMDTVLGTDYSKAHAKSATSIEILIVKVMHLLAQHRCGALVIEEAQVQNIGSKAFSRDFLMFFLRILNWGIPVVIVGNPLAFEQVKTHAQDVDRFSEGGWFSLLPELGPGNIWSKLWVPGLWGPSLLDNADATFTPLAKHPTATDWPTFLWELTGGIPRQLLRLRKEVMDYALSLRVGTVTSEFVLSVYEQSPSFTAVRKRNRAMAKHDHLALAEFEDLPVAMLREHWLSHGTPSLNNGNAAECEAIPSSSASTRPLSAARLI